MNNVIDHIKARFQSISLKKEGLGLLLLSLGCLLFSIIQRFYSFSWMPVNGDSFDNGCRLYAENTNEKLLSFKHIVVV